MVLEITEYVLMVPQEVLVATEEVLEVLYVGCSQA